MARTAGGAAIAIVAGLLVGAGAGPVDVAPSAPVRHVTAAAESGPAAVRWAGTDRSDTARLIAVDGTALAATFGDTAVVLARQDDFPDGLAAGYLSGQLGAPVLLTAQHALSSAAADAITARNPHVVMIVGGTSAVGAAVADDLVADGRTVHRVSGPDRYATAAAIARHGDPADRTGGLAIVASGENHPDALVASALAAGDGIPLLLTARDVLPDATATALDDLGIDEVLLAGGSAAVSPAVADAIRARGVTVTRIAGSDRYATAAAFARLTRDRFGWGTDHVNLATGQTFPDALALGAHAGLDHGGPAPIVLAARDLLPPSTAALLAEFASCRTAALHVAGGSAALSDATVAGAVTAATPAGGCTDTTAPAVTISQPADGATVHAGDFDVVLRGTTTDVGTGTAEVHVFDDDTHLGPAVLSRGADPRTFEMTLYPEPGTHVVAVVAVDAAGNETTATVTFTVTGPATADVVVAPETVVLDDVDLGHVVDVTDHAVIFDRVPDLGPGDVIAAPASPTTPEGLLRVVVVVVVRPDGSAEVVTAPADLTDAIRQGSLTAEPVLLPSTGDAQPGPDTDEGTYGSQVCLPGGADPPSEPDPDAYTFDTRILDASFGTVDLQGAIAVRPDLDVDIDIGWDWWPPSPTLDRFLFALDVDESLALDVIARAQANVHEDAEVVTVPFGALTFWVGPVPVVIVPQMAVDVGVDGQLVADVSAGFEQDLAFRVGAEYRDGGWHPLQRYQSVALEFERPTVSAGAAMDAEAWTRVTLSTDLYGVAGPTLSGRAYLALDADATATPWWTLGVGVEGRVGAHVRLPEVGDLARYDATVLAGKWELLSAESPSIAIVTPQDGATVRAGLLEVQLAGCDADFDEVHWFDETDTELGQGRATTVHVDPGDHTLRAEAWRDGGHDGTGVVHVSAVASTPDSFRITGSPRTALEFARTLARDPTIVAGASWIREPWNSYGGSARTLTEVAEPLGARAYGVDLPGFPDGATVGVLSNGNAYAADDVDGWTSSNYGGVDDTRGERVYDPLTLRIDLDVPPGDSCVAFDLRLYSEVYRDMIAFDEGVVAHLDAETWTMDSLTVRAPDSFARDPLGNLLTTWNIHYTYVDPGYAVETAYAAGTPTLRVSAPITAGAHALYLSLFDEGNGTGDSTVAIHDLRTFQAAAGSCPTGSVVR